jgi:predicted RNase H-like nuclease
MNFIGIDLGWKPKGGTALAVLNPKGRVTASTYKREEREIISYVESYSRRGCLVGIDAPLVVRNYRGRRRCEKQLQGMGIPSYPANRRWLLKAFRGVRGESLVAGLRKIGFELMDELTPGAETLGIMEVYPYATLRMLLNALPAYKKGSKAERSLGLNKLRRELARLHPPLMLPREFLNQDAESRLEELKKLADLLDAAVAAYTVYLYWLYGEERCVVLGDKEEGFILLPRKSLA